jgi:hypothetical protein
MLCVKSSEAKVYTKKDHISSQVLPLLSSCLGIIIVNLKVSFNIDIRGIVHQLAPHDRIYLHHPSIVILQISIVVSNKVTALTNTTQISAYPTLLLSTKVLEGVTHLRIICIPIHTCIRGRTHHTTCIVKSSTLAVPRDSYVRC